MTASQTTSEVIPVSPESTSTLKKILLGVGIGLIVSLLIFVMLAILGIISFKNTNTISNQNPTSTPTSVTTVTPTTTIAAAADTITPTTSINTPTTIITTKKPTGNVIVTPPSANYQTYTSEDLQISFYYPIDPSIKIVEKDNTYGANGCADGLNDISYKSLSIMLKEKELVWIGIPGECSPLYICDDATGKLSSEANCKTKYTWNLNNKPYTMLQDDNNNVFLSQSIQFGSQSKYAFPKVRSNTARMFSTSGFTLDEFHIGSEIISSITPMN